jgi:hypothetical protein
MNTRAFPPDDPEQLTVSVHPVDYEKARDELEARGYAVTSCETMPGCLRITASRKSCSCDLCIGLRTKEQAAR